MENCSIRIKNEVLQDYTCRRNRQNPVHKFWMKILNEMPCNLKEEVRLKRTDLIKQDNAKFDVKDVQLFQFETLSGSQELAQFLNKYIVFVEEEMQRLKDLEESFMQPQDNNMYALMLDN